MASTPVPQPTLEQQIADLRTEIETLKTDFRANQAPGASLSEYADRITALEALLEKHGIRQAE